MDAPPTDAPAEDTHVAHARLSEVPVLLFVRGVALLTVMLSLIVVLHWYLGLRLVDGLALPPAAATAGWAALWTGFGSIFFGFVGGRLLPRPLARAAQWLGFGWMGAFGLLLTATALSELVLLGLGARGPEAQAFRALGVVGVVVPALVVAFLVGRNPRTRLVEVPIAGLPEGLDGFTIAQLSDVHIGETLDRTFAQRVVNQTNAIDADVVVITGDMVDGGVERLKDEVAPLAGLTGKQGVYFVTGNHEYYHGGSAWEARAAALGFTVLHNSHVVLRRGGAELVLGGVPDVEGARFSSQHAPNAGKTFEGAPEGVTRVLLAHQPRFAKRAAGHGVSLMLSGHTHGGQMFPFMFFVRLQQPVIGGFKVLHGVPTWTSNGTGYWGPPFRLGPRGEVSKVVLRRAA